MIIFVYGEDTYRARQHVRELVEKFKRERDPGGYNVVKLDADTAESGLMLTELSSAPFLSPKRMVVLYNLLSNTDAEVIETVGEKLGKLPDWLIAIVVQTISVGKTKIAKNLFENLKKGPYAKECAPLTGVKLEEYINEYLKNKSAATEPGIARQIVEQLGSDLWQVTSTLDQLAAYAAPRAITASDLKLFIEEPVDDNIFHVVEAIVGGNTTAGYKLIAEQYRQGEDAGRILALIAWQLRILLSLASALERDPKIQSASLAQELKLNPFVVKKNMALARRVSLSTLEARFKELLSIDRMTKTGVASAATMLDVYVGR